MCSCRGGVLVSRRREGMPESSGDLDDQTRQVEANIPGSSGSELGRHPLAFGWVGVWERHAGGNSPTTDVIRAVSKRRRSGAGRAIRLAVVPGFTWHRAPSLQGGSHRDGLGPYRSEGVSEHRVGLVSFQVERWPSRRLREGHQYRGRGDQSGSPGFQFLRSDRVIHG